MIIIVYIIVCLPLSFIQMMEVFAGTGVYWYPANKSLVQTAAKNGTQLCSACVDVFFSRDVLRQSNLKGGGTKYKQLDRRITADITCELLF